VLHDDDNQVKVEASAFTVAFVLPYERETTSLRREHQTICIKQSAATGEAGNAMATTHER
jgi:hypothetical protein